MALIPPAGPPITLPLGWLLPGGLVSLDPGIQVKLWNFLLMQLVLALSWIYYLVGWSVGVQVFR
jgi:hypothetical protein